MEGILGGGVFAGTSTITMKSWQNQASSFVGLVFVLAG
jgi:hypothetical protein